MLGFLMEGHISLRLLTMIVHFCTSTDYFADLIEPSMTGTNLRYLALSGICNDVRGDSIHKITSVSGTNPAAELTSTTITNQFTTLPICFAFIVGDVQSRTTLMYAGGEALITIDTNVIMFTLGGNTAIFTNLNLVGVMSAQRVQICVDDTGAILYSNCSRIETSLFPFDADSIPPTTVVSVLLNNSAVFDVSKN